jgi:PAS domain S-box-containing protein
MRRKDGSYCWICARASFVEESDGRKVRLLGSHTDLTERKLAETALRASEERFHITIEAINEGMWDWNIPTNVVYFSPQWIRLLGYLPEEVTGSTAFFHSILHPDDVHRMTEILQAHLDGRTPLKELELRLRHKSGEYRWYLDRGKVVARDEQGRPLRMVGTITDITERKQVERERAEALANLQTIMETVPDVIFVLDLDGRLSKWNLRLETVTGYTCDELLGKPALEMVPATEVEQTSAAIRRALETGYAELEGHLLTKDGRPLRYHWNGAPFADLQGRVVGITGVGRDITERQQTEALLRSSEERFRLVAQATNDILWDWDLLTGDHWWSPNACEKFGYDPHKEPNIDAWSGRLHPEDRGAGARPGRPRHSHRDQHPLRRIPLSTGRRHLWVLSGSRPYRTGRGRGGRTNDRGYDRRHGTSASLCVPGGSLSTISGHVAGTAHGGVQRTSPAVARTPRRSRPIADLVEVRFDVGEAKRRGTICGRGSTRAGTSRSCVRHDGPVIYASASYCPSPPPSGLGGTRTEGRSRGSDRRRARQDSSALCTGVRAGTTPWRASAHVGDGVLSERPGTADECHPPCAGHDRVHSGSAESAGMAIDGHRRWRGIRCRGSLPLGEVRTARHTGTGGDSRRSCGDQFPGRFRHHGPGVYSCRHHG